MTPSRVELVIDELVLHGFSPAERRRIGRSMEQELGRLLGEAAAGGAIPPSLVTGGALALGDGGVVHVAAGATPEAAGAQLAAAVYRGMGGPAPATNGRMKR